MGSSDAESVQSRHSYSNYRKRFIDDMADDPFASDNEGQSDFGGEPEPEQDPNFDPDQGPPQEHEEEPVSEPLERDSEVTLERLKEQLRTLLDSDKLNKDIEGVFPAVVHELQCVTGQLDSVRARGLVDLCIEAMFQYVEGDKVFDFNGSVGVLHRLTRGFQCRPMIEQCTFHLDRLANTLLANVKAHPRADSAAQALAVRKIQLIRARIVAACRASAAINDFHATVSPYWDPLVDPVCTTTDIFEDLESQSTFQRAVSCAEQYCARRQLKVFNDFIYEPVVREGVYCRSYRPMPREGCPDECMSTIELLAQHVMNDPLNPDAQRDSVVPNFSQVAKLLSIKNRSLPLLVRNFRLFSFRNCLYDIERDVCYPHTGYIDANLYDGNVTACRFIDEDFNYTPDATRSFFGVDGLVQTDADFQEDPGDFMNSIPTPILDSIVDFQYPQTPEAQAELDAHLRVPDPRLLKRMLYAMLGRLLYKQNELDNFHCALMVIGATSTGKSILVNLFQRMIYDPQDTCAMTGNSEATFGISGAENKRLLVVSECGHVGLHNNRGINEADLLGLCTGDPTELRRKNQTPKTTILNPAILMAGNELPRWRNAENAMARRVFFFRWMRSVPPEQLDQTFERRLVSEVPGIIMKISRAYRWLLHYMNTHDIKHIQRVLPRHVRNNLLSLGASSSLVEYLESTTEYAVDIKTPLAKSVEQFRQLNAQQARQRWDRHPMDSEPPAVLLYMPFNDLHERYIAWCNKHRKDPYNKKPGRVDNRHENMEAWNVAFQLFYGPNVGFVTEDNMLATRLRAEYPRNCRADVEGYIVQNIEVRASVTEAEIEALQSMNDPARADSESGRQVQTQVPAVRRRLHELYSRFIARDFEGNVQAEFISDVDGPDVREALAMYVELTNQDSRLQNDATLQAYYRELRDLL